MVPSYTTLTSCRICRGRNLIEIINLGMQPLANAFLTREELDKDEPQYPLRVMFCPDCNLCQLGEVVNPELLFRDYIYFSTAMPRVSEHFRRYAQDVVARFASGKKAFVVEIGSNDGVMLAAVREMGPRILGVDPAVNIARIANERGIPTIAEFFGEDVARDIITTQGYANAIIGNNVVAHINDHHDLVRGVSRLLAPKGVFVFEAPYLVDMFDNLAFDTIYHEHMSYLAVRPLMRLFDDYDMEIVDVQVHPVQGNSLRVFAARKGAYPVEPSVETWLEHERAMGLHHVAAYQELARRVVALKEDMLTTLAKLKKRNKRIAGYGAPAKGNTLLNYFQIGHDMLDYATEELPSKIGLYTPGMHIPVIHRDDAHARMPDYFLMLAWNYRDAILDKEKQFRDQGGKFIMPIGMEERII